MEYKKYGKIMRVYEYGDNTKKGRIYIVPYIDFIKVDIDEDFNVYENENGKYTGFRVAVNGYYQYILEDFCKTYEEVEYEMSSMRTNGFGIGFNKIEAYIDCEKTLLSECVIQGEYNNCCLVIQ